MREVKMPSGAILKVNPAPFSDAKALYMAVAAEKKNVQFTSDTQILNIQLDAVCALISSVQVDRCLQECMKRCLYKDLKIDASTFEDPTAREDYGSACMEVMHENVYPLAKHLYAWLKPFFPAPVKSQE